MMPPLPSLLYSKRAAARAFTLIELLVVVAIIGILAAIALPVMNTVKTKSLQLKCLTNMKQLGNAFLAYASDNNGLLQWSGWPSVGGSDLYYEKYLSASSQRATIMNGKSVSATEYCRRCPAVPWDPNGSTNSPVGYVMTRPSPVDSSIGAYSLSRAATPTQLLVLIEGFGSENMTGTQGLIDYVKPMAIKTASNKPTDIRHGGGINALFGDGHTQQFRWADIDPAATNPTQAARVASWFVLY